MPRHEYARHTHARTPHAARLESVPLPTILVEVGLLYVQRARRAARHGQLAAESRRAGRGVANDMCAREMMV